MFIFLIPADNSFPRNFHASYIGSRKIKFTWSEPSNIDGKLEGYRIVCHKTSDILRSAAIRIMNILRNETTIDGLKPFTNYTCAVRAVTSFGDGKSSPLIVVRTNETGKYVSYLIFIWIESIKVQKNMSYCCLPLESRKS